MAENDSIIQKILDRQLKSGEDNAIAKEREQEFKLSLNRIFSTNVGQMFGKYLIIYRGVVAPTRATDPVRRLEAQIKRDIYMEFIRPYLDRDVRIELENQQ